jgi:hypothetical protein
LSIDANGIVTVAANTQVVRKHHLTNEANPSTGLNVTPAIGYRYRHSGKQSNRW